MSKQVKGLCLALLGAIWIFAFANYIDNIHMILQLLGSFSLIIPVTMVWYGISWIIEKPKEKDKK